MFPILKRNQYRSFAGPTKHRYSDEQYIEVRPSPRQSPPPRSTSPVHTAGDLTLASFNFFGTQMFDADLVNIPADPPAWYADGERMWREEEEEAEAEAEAGRGRTLTSS